MKFLVGLTCITLLALNGCRCRASESQGEQGIPAPLATPLSAAELLDRVSPYYPRWDPEEESLDRYIERYRNTSELASLKRVVTKALEQDKKWRAFLRDLRTSLPGYFIQDAAPPWDTIPSYQVVIGYEYPPDSGKSKHIIFRLSHLAPVFDYHESDRASNGHRISLRQSPTSEATPIALLVSRKIVEHFPHRHLDPDVGATPVPDIHLGTLLPGSVTLADALFGESPTW